MLAGDSVVSLVLLQVFKCFSQHLVCDLGWILRKRVLFAAGCSVEFNYTAVCFAVVQSVLPHVESLSDFRLSLQMSKSRKQEPEKHDIEMHLSHEALLFLSEQSHVVVGKGQQCHLNPKNKEDIYEEARLLLLGDRCLLPVMFHHGAERQCVVVCTHL